MFLPYCKHSRYPIRQFKMITDEDSIVQLGRPTYVPFHYWEGDRDWEGDSKVVTCQTQRPLHHYSYKSDEKLKEDERSFTTTEDIDSYLYLNVAVAGSLRIFQNVQRFCRDACPNGSADLQ